MTFISIVYFRIKQMATWSPLPLSSNETSSPSNSTLCPDLEEWWDVVYQVVPTYINIVCIIGTLGNIFVFSVFLLYKGRLNVAEIYFVNLAAADMIFLACFPFWAENIRNKYNWPFTNFLCRITNASIKLNMYTSIYLLVAISVDRYLAFAHTLTSRGKRSNAQAKVMCLLIWGFGIVMSIPTFMFRSVKHVQNLNISACILAFPSESWETADRLTLNALGFVIPSIVIIVFNCQIVRSLRENKRSQAKLKTKISKDHTNTKATMLIFTVVLTFLLCWAPCHFFLFLDFLFRMKAVKGCFWEELINFGSQFTSYLAFTNSCLNPVIYVFFGKYFREKTFKVYTQFFPNGYPLQCMAPRERSSYFTSGLKQVILT
ncbi:B1 bradykinin receptor [Alligator mississippiensis]|uniref:B1 bradykinin receptor n=1 Tax=Alligator mississippiensis TaxID=8496 RepID=UPI0009070950|nr:B1 bradykinin receptor [Alligator mississippiensis]